MLEISLHILDLVENSLDAGASLVELAIVEDPSADRMEITLRDNGRGMDPAFLAKAFDPFVTTRTTRRVGLGLGLMRANARAWGGDLELTSTPGQGTDLHVWFQLSHIDRQPLGDMASTLGGLIISRPEVDFVYRHRVGDDEFELDTREIKAELDDVPISDPAVVQHLQQQIGQALQALGSTG